MSVTVTCECGHVTELDSREQFEETTSGIAQSGVRRFCSACGRSLAEAASSLTETTPAPAPTFRQLWQSHLSENAAEASDESRTSVEQRSGDPLSTSSGRRSLWDVMRGTSDDVRLDRSQAPQNLGLAEESPTIPPHRNPPILNSMVPDPSLVAEPSKPKGLWSVMSAASESVEPVTDAGSSGAVISDASESFKPLSLTLSPDARAREPNNEDNADAKLVAVPIVESAPATVTAVPDPSLKTQWCVRALVALAFSIAAVMLAGLSLWPGWLVRLPSMIAGVIAVLLGYTATGDVRQSRGRLKGSAVASSGVVLGTVGMFLAPLVFARLGDQRRENAGREEIEHRLRQIAAALDQHHAQHGHYPPAVVFGRAAGGEQQPLHGWMTPLLPYLGHETIERRINRQQRFDAPANIVAMQQIIPKFLIPGRKPERSPRGFGLTHFSGVGGEAVREPAGLVRLGIFSEGVPVRREQVTDGLGQTLIIGEIPDTFPAWGEPGNVRMVGAGLNKQFHGFGNPAGTGAMFLHGDGSVRFYSNKTDRRVLEQLETRDGAEPVQP